MAKISVAIRIEQAWIERLRNAVWHLGKGRTVASVLSAALEKELAELELQNGSKPYPPRRLSSQALEQQLPQKRRNRRPGPRP